MNTDDVAAAQQLIKLDLLKCDIDSSENMMFETEHMTAEGVGQAGNLQPDMTASNNPEGLSNNSWPTSSRLLPPARMVASAATIRRNSAIMRPMATSLAAW